MIKEKILLSGIIIICIFLFTTQTYVVISDPTLNVSNHTAGGGNTTKLDLDSEKASNIWQGYFGNVNGGITLDDADDFTFYDWSTTDAAGEVLATRAVISDWSDINCSNQTEIYIEEERLSITNASEEGINDTYLNTTHPGFSVSGLSISGCRSTQALNSTGSPTFWNVLLNTDENTTVYTSIIVEDEIGFNGSTVDFQLMVPTNTTDNQAIYNIYVELT